MAFRAGDELGQFRLLEPLGEGGMGVVWRAHDSDLHRDVAIKVLPAEFVGDSERRARLVREARAAAAVTHPNVAAIHQIGEADKGVYVVMELVEGESLRQRMHRAPLSPDQAIWVIREAAEGVAAAHRRGVTHRDLKPENVMLGVAGEVKVLDFGLAKISGGQAPSATLKTEAGAVLGTPGYLSPEQARGEQADPRSDVFSLGVMLFELLVGARPFQGATPMEAIIAVARDAAPPLGPLCPGLPEAAVQAVDRCLAPEPSDRFAAAGEVAAALAEAHGSVESLAVAETLYTPPGEITLPAPGRSRVPTLVAGGALAVAAALVAGLSLGGGERPPEPSPAPPAATAPADDSKTRASERYEAGRLAWRQGDGDGMQRSFEAALDLDPDHGWAALHLAHRDYRRGWLRKSRDHLDRIWDRREGLSPAQRAYSEGLRRLIISVPPDHGAALAGFAKASAAAPGDAKLLHTLAFYTTEAEGPEAARAIAARAAALPDPAVPALAFVAVLDAYLERFDDARAALDRCVELHPKASGCLQHRIWINQAQGRCDAVLADARRFVAAHPGLAHPQMVLANALASLGQPIAAVREATRQAVSRSPEEQRAELESASAGAVAILDGDLNLAAATLVPSSEAVKLSTNDQRRSHALEVRLDVALEAGDQSQARGLAEEFLGLYAALEPYPRSDDAQMGYDRRPMIFGVLRRLGAVDDDGLRAHLEGWFKEWESRKILPFWRRYLWIAGHARAAALSESPQAARRALEALPAYAPIPRYFPAFMTDGFVGRTYLLAGDADGAIPWLERGAANCQRGAHVIEHMRTLLALGQAREALDDDEAACAAYRRVVDRWGHAKPAPRTAARARKRIKALRCAD